MKRSLYGRSIHSRTDIQDQSLFTELFLVHLRDSSPSLLNIWEESGHSGFHQDKQSLSQFQKSSLNTPREFKYIFINKVSKLSLTDQITPLLRKLERLNYHNGTISWLLEKKSKSSVPLILEAESKRLLEAKELTRLLISSDHCYLKDLKYLSNYNLRPGLQQTSQ
jgi:hypothetical protein